MLDVDSNGYVIGPNGTPATDYLPLFQPQVNAAGQMVGVTQNTGSLNAIMQIPACMTIANDTSLTPQARETALEACSATYKGVSIVTNPS